MGSDFHAGHQAEPLTEAMRQHLIEDLHRQRAGFGVAASVTGEAFLRTPSCGDEIRVQVSVVENTITALNWQGHGCIVSTAAASALSLEGVGLPVGLFAELAEKYRDSVWNGVLPDDDLGEAAVFVGMGRLPLRGRCATLAWNATAEAIAASASR